MRKPGSTLYFTKERRQDILNAFHNIIAQSPHINIRQISHAVALAGASRFWISEERAAMVISRLQRGLPVPGPLRPLRQKMFHDLFNSYLNIRKSNPRLPFAMAVHLAVNSPAPQFYLAPESIARIIYRHYASFRK